MYDTIILYYLTFVAWFNSTVPKREKLFGTLIIFKNTLRKNKCCPHFSRFWLIPAFSVSVLSLSRFVRSDLWIFRFPRISLQLSLISCPLVSWCQTLGQNEATYIPAHILIYPVGSRETQHCWRRRCTGREERGAVETYAWYDDDYCCCVPGTIPVLLYERPICAPHASQEGGEWNTTQQIN